MHAYIRTGGKQYKVKNGQFITVEKLDGQSGDHVEFTEVLMLADGDNVQLGEPYLKGVKVIAEIVEQSRGEKIDVIKFKRRKGYRRKIGHRQYITKLKVK